MFPTVHYIGCPTWEIVAHGRLDVPNSKNGFKTASMDKILLNTACELYFLVLVFMRNAIGCSVTLTLNI